MSRRYRTGRVSSDKPIRKYPTAPPGPAPGARGQRLVPGVVPPVRSSPPDVRKRERPDPYEIEMQSIRGERDKLRARLDAEKQRARRIRELSDEVQELTRPGLRLTPHGVAQLKPGLPCIPKVFYEFGMAVQRGYVQHWRLAAWAWRIGTILIAALLIIRPG